MPDLAQDFTLPPSFGGMSISALLDRIGGGESAGPNPSGGQPGSAGTGGTFSNEGLLGGALRSGLSTGVGQLAAGSLFGPAGMLASLVGTLAQQGLLGPNLQGNLNAAIDTNPAGFTGFEGESPGFLGSQAETNAAAQLAHSIDEAANNPSGAPSSIDVAALGPLGQGAGGGQPGTADFGNTGNAAATQGATSGLGGFSGQLGGGGGAGGGGNSGAGLGAGAGEGAGGFGGSGGVGNYAGGGLVRGGGPGQKGNDKVPIMATEGEFVMNKHAVNLLGEDTINLINSVARSPAPTFAKMLLIHSALKPKSKK